jgi:hypothetical protein
MVFFSWHCDFSDAQSKGRAIGFLFLKKSLLYCYFDCFVPIFIGCATV